MNEALTILDNRVCNERIYNIHMPGAAFLWTPKPKEDRRNVSTQQ